MNGRYRLRAADLRRTAHAATYVAPASDTFFTSASRSDGLSVMPGSTGMQLIIAAMPASRKRASARTRDSGAGERSCGASGRRMPCLEPTRQLAIERNQRDVDGQVGYPVTVRDEIDPASD